MTPEEWEACRQPRAMLQFFGERAGARKARLLAVACCRLRWGQVPDGWFHRALEAAEAYVDGPPNKKALDAARRAASSAYAQAEVALRVAYQDAVAAGMSADHYGPFREVALVWHAAEAAAQVTSRGSRSATAAVPPGERPDHCGLVRCLFGNPWRPACLDPAVLAWNGGAASRLAECIYDGRRFGDLPVLADLLEEAGCTDAALLRHLRGPGPHALGCWALDAVLGKS
jgi:hypothetical protein